MDTEMQAIGSPEHHDYQAYAASPSNHSYMSLVPYQIVTGRKTARRNMQVVSNSDLDPDLNAPEEDEAQDEDELEEMDAVKEARIRKNELRTLYFEDGKMKIDYVLVWKDDDDERRLHKRQYFEEKLLEEGCHLETSDRSSYGDHHTHFTKLHVPFCVLIKFAELMKLKMPIKTAFGGKKSQASLFTSLTKALLNPLDIDHDTIQEDTTEYTMVFNKHRLDIFDIPENEEEFFTSAQRSAIANEILARCQYDPGAPEKIGIGRLIANGTYHSSFALHDGPYKKSKYSKVSIEDNDRMKLYDQWARLSAWYRFQPLDLIRNYFGEKIVFYFAWMGFYTQMLIPAAIVGLLCFIYGVITADSFVPVQDICSNDTNITMCPQCANNCDYLSLSQSCLYAKVSYYFDNWATVWFAVFMSFWATIYLELWKRKQVRLAWDYDVYDFERSLETTRPEFDVSVSTKRLNPVTKQNEPYLPRWNRYIRWTTSAITVIFLVCVVLAAVFGVIVYRMIVVTQFYSIESKFLQQYAKIITSTTAAGINLLIIVILSRLYENVALWLTEMENPRTQTDFEDSIIIKNFAFQFVNNFSSLFYIAFIKGKVPEGKLLQRTIFSINSEECDAGGCLVELCIQLMIIFVGKQVLNAKEMVLPILTKLWRNRVTYRGKVRSSTSDGKNVVVTTSSKGEKVSRRYGRVRWEQDLLLSDYPALGMTDDYLEMAIQYGFVTLFVAAFPLAPLFALINNVIEIRLDAYKVVTTWKRPLSERTSDIGAWFDVLNFLSTCAVVTNGFVIAFTSEFIPRVVYMFGEGFDEVMNRGYLEGFVEWKLSKVKISDMKDRLPNATRSNFTGEICYYPDFRNPPEHDRKYEFSLSHWYVLAARLAFIIAFEHAVIFVTKFLSFIIPDVPGDLKSEMEHEEQAAKEALLKQTGRKLIKHATIGEQQNESGGVLAPPAFGEVGAGDYSSNAVKHMA